jgi:hypothetical protein
LLVGGVVGVCPLGCGDVYGTSKPTALAELKETQVLERKMTLRRLERYPRAVILAVVPVWCTKNARSAETCCVPFLRACVRHFSGLVSS